MTIIRISAFTMLGVGFFCAVAGTAFPWVRDALVSSAYSNELPPDAEPITENTPEPIPFAPLLVPMESAAESIGLGANLPLPIAALGLNRVALPGGHAGGVAASKEPIEVAMREAPNLFVPEPGQSPANIIRLATRHRYVAVVDLGRSRLYLLENTPNGMQIVRQHYASMGINGFGKKSSGDLRTPVGIYSVENFLADATLPDLYGSGAFPLNYPNEWDLRKNRSGSGIWLHGVPPNTYNRPPRSSQGCVTMSNADLLALRAYLKNHETPVLLVDDLRWQPASENEALSAELTNTIEAWRTRWSNVDTEGYLSFYADDFRSAGMDKAAFSAFKRRINAAKSHISVNIRELDIFRYPGEEKLVLARFLQDYDSSNYTITSSKTQFWRQLDDGSWKMVLEESRELP